MKEFSCNNHSISFTNSKYKSTNTTEEDFINQFNAEERKRDLT